MFKKQVALVAGFDYEFNGLDFATICKNRIQRLIAKYPKDQLRFTLFDVGAGTVTQNELSAPNKRSWSTLKTFTATSRGNYSAVVVGKENHFDQNPAGIMSITDAYEFIQKIGAGSEAGTLKEFSVFAHGWVGGPILVNSSDLASGATRDPGDKDARARKDFNTPNMTAAMLTNFQKAFDGSGIVWTWGCSFARAYNLILAALFKHKKYKSIPRGKVKPTDMFDMEFEEDLSKTDGPARFDDIRGMLPGGALKAGPPRNYKITVAFLTITNLLKTDLSDAYSAKVATASGKTAFGALLGTYADFEKGGKNPLMLIPRKHPPYADDFTRVINFYKHYVHIAIDPENRGYGKF
ncbi:hypothetical protein [Dyella sp. Tek66A03]|uniref:hypothetical protein n=1 Tax=Dyella sp. Tek66A03 TaxID=3458298 RepID=UPI00403E39D3